MIQTILFDLGNVLVHFSEDKLQRQLAKALNITTPKKSIFHQGIRYLYETGRINDKELCDYLSLHAEEKSVSHKTILHAFSDIFWPNSSVFPVIRSLSEQGVRLILLSNTSKAHYTFIRKKYPVLEWFHDVVLSYKVGAVKPSRQIFETALIAAQCPVENCFYTDDTEEHIKAARKYRIDAELFTNTETLIEQLKQRGITI